MADVPNMTRMQAPADTIARRVRSRELQTELVRKAIHTIVAFVPTIAAVFGRDLAVFLLASGTLFYAVAEQLRISGRRVFIVTRLTLLAARERDRGTIVLGPITLGLGAMLSLLLYPAPVATIAIYALAFGDGFASLVGKFFGTIRIPFTGGKTLEGSLTCFIAVFVSSYAVLGRTDHALLVAVAGTFFEALPIRDVDNLIVPLGVGLVVRFLIL